MGRNQKKYIVIVLFLSIFIISCYIGVKKNYFKDMGLDLSKTKTNSIVEEPESVGESGSKPYGGLLTASMNEDINISFKIMKDSYAYNFNVFDYKISKSKDFSYNFNFYLDDEEKYLDQNKKFIDGYSYIEIMTKITNLSDTDTLDANRIPISPYVYMLNQNGIANLKSNPNIICAFSLRGDCSTSTMDSKGDIFLKPREIGTLTFCFVIPDEYLEDQLVIKFFDKSLKVNDPYVLLKKMDNIN